MKERFKTLVILGIVLLIILLLILGYGILSDSKLYCDLKGGRISNELGIINYSDEGEFFPIYGKICNENETNIGYVGGFKCNCICCIPKK